MTMEIREVDFGIGSRYKDKNGVEFIEINRYLPADLREEVLKHELNHEEGLKGFFSHTPTLNLKLWLWMFKHPKSFRNFIPYNKGYWDVGMIMAWYFIFVIVAAFAAYWILYLKHGRII